MDWLQSLDTSLFRFVNLTMSAPWLDGVMPFFSGNALFGPLVLIAGVTIFFKGGVRARMCVAMIVLAVLLGDGLVCNTLKHVIGRLRPFNDIADAHVLVGRGGSGSMPSSHAANWFAAAMVAFLYYRRSAWIMLPLAVLVSFSRVYVGVHYPSDVLVGAILGAGTGVGVLVVVQMVWSALGSRLFPQWWNRLPSLWSPSFSAEAVDQSTRAMTPASHADADRNYVRLGYVIIAVLLLVRLWYLASGKIELSKDEAYQWLWSKHLALSYYSKPPGIAYLQYLGTHLWGDTELGVRFCSPVFAALLSVVLLRFMAREVGARPAFLLMLILTAAPLMSLGTILMTIDPPLVFCWTCAMIVGWRAVKPDGTTKHWLLVGLAMGFGFLSKYSAAYQVLCFALVFALWSPSRVHLKRPGPYLALLLLLLSTLPVVIWNAQHNWITVRHVSENAALATPWKPTLKYLIDFLLAEGGLLNPVFFVGALWAMIAAWRRRAGNPLWLYFICMGAPVFLGHLAYAFHSRILPNWIAPAVVPLFCLMVAYWDSRWREGVRAVKPWLTGALVFGLFAALILHESNLIGKLVGQPLPAEKDPLRRVRAWKETAAVVDCARQKLAREGKPAFIIADHYGMAGLFSFYLPQARAALRDKPLVYYQTSLVPDNQFYFWPGYRGHHTGENAIYVIEHGPVDLRADWWWRWLRGKELVYDAPQPVLGTPPELLKQEFASVTDLGMFDVKLRGRVFRRVQLFECRGLR